MTEHMKRSVDLAGKITTFVEQAVGPLERTIDTWPADFRAVMWDAVAIVAKDRADKARVSDYQKRLDAAQS